MSDEVTTVAPESAQPVVTPETTTVVETPTAETPLRSADIKRSASQRAREIATESFRKVIETRKAAIESTTVDNKGRAHAADGKYLPGAADAAPTEPQAATQPADTTPTPAASQPTIVRIPVPEGSSLRDQGIQEIPTTPENELAIRALLNGETRRKAVEQANAVAAQLQERVAILEAQLKARQELRTGLPPEVQNDVNELRAIGRDDIADALIRDFERKEAEKADEYAGVARNELRTTNTRAEVAAFQVDTIQAARGRYPQSWVQSPNFEQNFKRALFQYGTDVEFRVNAGENVSLSADGVFEFLDRLYLADPAAQEQTRKAIEERNARAAAEAAAKATSDATANEAARLAEAAKRHATNTPLSRIPSNVRTDRVSGTPGVDLTKMTPAQIKKTLKQNLFSRTG